MVKSILEVQSQEPLQVRRSTRAACAEVQLLHQHHTEHSLMAVESPTGSHHCF